MGSGNGDKPGKNQDLDKEHSLDQQQNQEEKNPVDPPEDELIQSHGSGNGDKPD